MEHVGKIMALMLVLGIVIGTLVSSLALTKINF